MKNTIVILTVVILGSGVFWFFSQEGANERVENTPSVVTEAGVTHHIVLTDEGYKPESVSINLGDAVIFSNETGRPFWPASNLHPSHRDYPQFDPRKPVLTDEVWAFTFVQKGEWKYHDHLAPYFTGVIIVSE